MISRLNRRTPMKLVRQMYNCDCGVACVAMLADVKYDRAMEVVAKAFEAARSRRYRADKSGTTTHDIKLALNMLGKVVISQGPARSFEEIPANSLVSVKHPRRNLTHWVVWTGKRVYCPTEGSRGRTRYNWKPQKYVQVA
jgi:ABC-type bacteriocin/lantibiotic exporter with double-glycine peptidase domain